MIRILHVITGLGTGGAEMMLYKLLSRIDRREFHSSVIALTDGGPIADKIRSLGVPLKLLGFRPGLPNPLIVANLVGEIRHRKPHLIQTWLHHANLAGGLAARLAGSVPTVWGIRHTAVESRAHGLQTVGITRLSARLSRLLCTVAVSNSVAAMDYHEAIGYNRDHMVMIPNGFDLNLFKPDPEARTGLRRELGLGPNAPLVGMMARFHPQKGHEVFVRAAGMLHESRPDVHYVLAGDGIDAGNSTLCRWITEAGTTGVTHLLGRRSDTPFITAALDVAALSSPTGESFPNTIGEAMACAVPCVTTDIGDCRAIIGDTGIIVPVRDPHKLADGWRELLTMQQEDRFRLGRKARGRVEERFELGRVAEMYQDLYRRVLGVDN